MDDSYYSKSVPSTRYFGRKWSCVSFSIRSLTGFKSIRSNTIFGGVNDDCESL